MVRWRRQSHSLADECCNLEPHTYLCCEPVVAFFKMNNCLYSRILRSLCRAVLCSFWLAPLALSAHVVETGHGTFSLTGKQVFAVIAIPVAAFTGADDNADGVLDWAEIQTHQADLIAQVQRGLLLDGDGRKAVWSQMLLTPAEPGSPATRTALSAPSQLVVVGAAKWDHLPAVVTLEYGLWSRTPLVSISAPGPVVETLKVKVLRIEEGKTLAEEVGLLSPSQSRLEFFAPVKRHVVNFAHHGFDHILGGADHIIFLVALLASGINVRRWAALLTAFTLAHGVTFGLASMGWVSVSSTLVEQAIAASIVLVSALNLLRVKVVLKWELLIVFVLGLVHGLGFASAMREEGASQLIALSPYPVWSIVGFNLGIEVGQISVALALYALVLVLRRLYADKSDAVWQRAAGVLSLVVGTFWLVERIV